MHLWLQILLITLGAALACAGILWALLASGLAWRLATDTPNHRSLHTRPTPRVGGWGIVPVGALGMLGISPQFGPIAVSALLLAAMSQIDDRRGLPARIRFAGHLCAVLMLIILYPVAAPWWMLALLAVCLVWLINLYNFMDGADGLAGGMALLGFGAYAAAALIGGQASLALVCAAVAGCAAGFLLFNFAPARIFLGDAGSIPLGFLAGALGYWGWSKEVWPIWFPVVTFAPFIGDASVTLAKRLLKGEKFWHPHREHYYQRMVRWGASHRRVALLWYALMLAGIMLALWALGRPISMQWGLVVIWGAVLVLLGLVIDIRWRRFLSTLSESS